MDWLARDGLRADQHERYVQPLYEPWAICSLESRSTYRARSDGDDLPSWRIWMTRGAPVVRMFPTLTASFSCKPVMCRRCFTPD